MLSRYLVFYQRQYINVELSPATLNVPEPEYNIWFDSTTFIEENQFQCLKVSTCTCYEERDRFENSFV